MQLLEVESRHAAERARLHEAEATLRVRLAEVEGQLAEVEKKQQQDARTKNATSAWHTASSQARRVAAVEASCVCSCLLSVLSVLSVCVLSA